MTTARIVFGALSKGRIRRISIRKNLKPAQYFDCLSYGEVIEIVQREVSYNLSPTDLPEESFPATYQVEFSEHVGVPVAWLSRVNFLTGVEPNF